MRCYVGSLFAEMRENPAFSSERSYPICTCDLQLSENVVLSSLLLHVPHTHVPELLCCACVWPVAYTFILRMDKVQINLGISF